jgi:hypothetical protein
VGGLFGGIRVQGRGEFFGLFSDAFGVFGRERFDDIGAQARNALCLFECGDHFQTDGFVGSAFEGCQQLRHFQWAGIPDGISQ